ncbi:unnamed protein product [Paramecium octaurelia]|uniref:Tyrosine-protein phosphatase domain-containing protein n=1 Tax=Paramecium octaurelia TaxID=43137 RepID=A0A8S1STB0_PAROT|nr:unnamed protein product [Paramecium octaurelia]
MNYDYIGVIKVEDGIFLVDQFASQDLEFIVTNKISSIINWASKQIPNHWESIGIIYISFPWIDNDQQIIFQSDESTNIAIRFIDDALINVESVIMLSAKGQNRSVSVLCVYLMKKYRWTLIRHYNLCIIEDQIQRRKLIFLINYYQQKLDCRNKDMEQKLGENDEMLLRNTYLISQTSGVAEFKDLDSKPKEFKLKFADKITMQIPPYDKIIFSKILEGTIIKINYEQNYNIYDQQAQKLNQPHQLKQSPLYTSPIQPQRPSSVQQIQQQRVQQNNFMNSRDQFFQKQQQQNQNGFTGSSRPQTAPNQLKAPRVQTTPYKGNIYSGQKSQSGKYPNSQFKPMKQRAQSPKTVYNVSNPYVQREFKAKTMKI